MDNIDTNRRFFYPAFKYIGFAMFAMAGFAVASYFIPPLLVVIILHSLFVASAVFLTGILFATLTYLFSALQCIDYLTGGHKEKKLGSIASNKRLPNALAAGIGSSWKRSLFAASLFGASTLICSLLSYPLLSFLLPVIVFSLALSLVFSEIYCRLKHTVRTSNSEVESDFTEITTDHCLSFAQTKNLISKQQKAAWLQCHDRNSFAFKSFHVIGILSLAGMTCARVFSAQLPSFVLHIPPLFYAFSLALPVQIGLVALPCLVLTIGLIYFAFTHNKISKEQPANAPEQKNYSYKHKDYQKKEKHLKSTSIIMKTTNHADRKNSINNEENQTYHRTHYGPPLDLLPGRPLPPENSSRVFEAALDSLNGNDVSDEEAEREGFNLTNGFRRRGAARHTQRM